MYGIALPLKTALSHFPLVTKVFFSYYTFSLISIMDNNVINRNNLFALGFFFCFIEVVIILYKRNTIFTLWENLINNYNYSFTVGYYLTLSPVSLFLTGYFTGTAIISCLLFGHFIDRNILHIKFCTLNFKILIMLADMG